MAQAADEELPDFMVDIDAALAISGDAAPEEAEQDNFDDFGDVNLDELSVEIDEVKSRTRSCGIEINLPSSVAPR